MRAIIIHKDNNRMITDLQKSLEDMPTVPYAIKGNNTKNAYYILDEINASVKENEKVILFIDVQIPNKNPQDLNLYYGIEILKELRARSRFSTINRMRRCVVVLFSIFSMEKLLRMDVDFFIITSPGTYYHQISPKRFADLNVAHLLTQGLTDLKVLKPYYKVTDKTFEERHNYANWWAANQLRNHLNRLDNKAFYNSDLSIKVSALRDAQFIYSETESNGIKAETDKKQKEYLERQRNAFLEVGLQIILIDDQADQIEFETNMGWKDIYEDLLFRKEQNIKSLSISQSDKRITDYINDKCSCLLLDLFLDKSDENKAIDETRGARLLHQIRRKYPMLPIIVTTASNKAKKRKTLRELGCDAFWIKEGIDEQLNPTESLARYMQLVELISKLTNDEFSFLKESMRLIDYMNKKKMWWENDIPWANNTKQMDKKKVVGVLMQCLFLLRTYLHNQVLGEGYRTKLEEDFWLTGVIIKSATIIEEFHANEISSNISTATLHDHADQLGVRLYLIRHQVAHYNNSYPIDFKLLKIFFSAMLCYLAISPCKSHRISSRHEKRVIKQLLKDDTNYNQIYTKYFSNQK